MSPSRTPRRDNGRRCHDAEKGRLGCVLRARVIRLRRLRCRLLRLTRHCGFTRSLAEVRPRATGRSITTATPQGSARCQGKKQNRRSFFDHDYPAVSARSSVAVLGLSNCNTRSRVQCTGFAANFATVEPLWAAVARSANYSTSSPVSLSNRKKSQLPETVHPSVRTNSKSPSSSSNIAGTSWAC
jgi:hypothetical protein